MVNDNNNDKYKLLDRLIFKKLQDYSITKNNFNTFSDDGDSSLTFLIKNNIEFDVNEALRIIDLSDINQTDYQKYTPLMVLFNTITEYDIDTSDHSWIKPSIIESLIEKSDINYTNPHGMSATVILLANLEMIQFNNRTWKNYIEKLDIDLITPNHVEKIRKIADLCGYDCTKKPALMPIESRELHVIKHEFSKMEALISKNMFVRSSKNTP